MKLAKSLFSKNEGNSHTRSRASAALLNNISLKRKMPEEIEQKLRQNILLAKEDINQDSSVHSENPQAHLVTGSSTGGPDKDPKDKKDNSKTSRKTREERELPEPKTEKGSVRRENRDLGIARISRTKSDALKKFSLSNRIRKSTITKSRYPNPIDANRIDNLNPNGVDTGFAVTKNGDLWFKLPNTSVRYGENKFINAKDLKVDLIRLRLWPY